MNFDNLKVGMLATDDHTITENLINQFGELSGDYNAIHFNDEVAIQKGFKGRIAHGMIIGAFISKLIATKLPGDGSIYLSQNLNFKLPTYLNDKVKVQVKIINLHSKRRIVELETIALKEHLILVEGSAIVKLIS
tara:strand:+ start:456 stop:860 length:405 start_codon:yes stop_codon:yes gene_type:complete